MNERHLNPAGIGERTGVTGTRGDRTKDRCRGRRRADLPGVLRSSGNEKSSDRTVARAPAAKFKFPRSPRRADHVQRSEAGDGDGDGRARCRCRRCNSPEIRLKFSRMGRGKCRFLEFPGVCQVAPRRTSGPGATRATVLCDQHGGERSQCSL